MNNGSLNFPLVTINVRLFRSVVYRFLSQVSSLPRHRPYSFGFSSFSACLSPEDFSEESPGYDTPILCSYPVPLLSQQDGTTFRVKLAKKVVAFCPAGGDASRYTLDSCKKRWDFLCPSTDVPVIQVHIGRFPVADR